MKKNTLIVLAAIVLLLAAAGTVTGVLTHRAVERAEETHAAVYEDYETLLEQLYAAELPVYEQGALVDAYTLNELGLQESAEAQLEEVYQAFDRMTPEEFAGRSIWDKLRWNKEAHPENVRIEVPMTGFTPNAVLSDLVEIRRAQPVDAYMTYENGVYRVHDEVLGNVLQEDVVAEQLRTALEGFVISADAEALSALELTDRDCYVTPEVTVQNGGFNPGGDLYEKLGEMILEVSFHTGTEQLSPDDLRALVSLDPDGAVMIDEPALDAILAGWAETYNVYETPYLFNSYAGGVVPIDFLLCNYEVKTDELKAWIAERIYAQESGGRDAPYACYDKKWQPFSIENTYVEVDIHNQQITYYQDGKLMVNSDIVTGRVYANWDTPEGLYSAHDIRPDRWLVGEDYCVFVKYWVRIWNAYGLHDASWREEFGGDRYIRNGSHGCVNIPEAAMEIIYNNIVEGTPVLVFDYVPADAE